MTKREIAFTVLRERANEWVSGSALVEAGVGWRYSARLFELRQAGHVIEERPDPTGKSAVHEYRLVIPDVAPGQVALWDAA
jgi:hypothetical protein